MEKLNHDMAIGLYNSLDGAPNVIAPDLFLCLLTLVGENTSCPLVHIWRQLEAYRDPPIRYAMLLQLKDRSILPSVILGDLEENIRVVTSKKNRLEGKLVFRAVWKHGFDRSLDTQEIFHETPNKTITMMHQSNYYQYFQNSRYQLLEIPLADERHQVGIILPRNWQEDQAELGQFNQPLLASRELEEMINNLRFTYVDLSLPLMKGRKIFCLTDLASKKLWGGGTRKKVGATCFITYTMSHDGEMADTPLTESPATEFNANHVYCFYLRDANTNTFLMYGDYQG